MAVPLSLTPGSSVKFIPSSEIAHFKQLFNYAQGLWLLSEDFAFSLNPRSNNQSRPAIISSILVMSRALTFPS